MKTEYFKNDIFSHQMVVKMQRIKIGFLFYGTHIDDILTNIHPSSFHKNFKTHFFFFINYHGYFTAELN